MGKQVIRRLLSALAVMLVVILLTFIALDLVPGNAALVALGTEGNSEALAELEAEMGLDRSLGERLADYYISLFRFDLGTSSYYGQSVSSLISSRLGLTFSLAFFSVLISFAFSLALGSAAALKRGSVLDGFSRSLVQILSSVPSFWLSLLLLVLFSSILGWINVGEYTSPFVSLSGYLKSIAIPVVVLAIGESGPMLRLVRSSMISSLSCDWYTAAIVKGVRKRTAVVSYALRHAISAPVTLAGSQMAKLLGGTAIVESVFALPGLGRLFLTAVEMRDLALVQGIVIFVSFFVVLMNLVVDLVLAVANPEGRGL